jgi:hypothetical protein
MATQPCPDIAQAQIQMMCDAQTIEHSFYFKRDAGWTEALITALAAEMGTQWVLHMMADYPAAVTAVRAVATDLTSLAGSRAVYEIPLTPGGSDTGDVSPNNVCLAFQVSTGNRGRGRQGRIFYGPMSIDHISGDQVAEVHADAVKGDLAAVTAAILAAIPGTQWVVLSRWLDGAKRAEGVGIPAQGIVYTNLYLDSQKDRLPQHRKRKKKKTTPAP